MKTPQLTQQTADGVEPRGAFVHPGGAEAVERGQRLLGHGLHRHRVDVFVAAGLEYALGVGAVGLVAANVRTDVMRWKQEHGVAERLDPTAPVVRGTARLHHHGRAGLLGEEGQEFVAAETLATRDSSRSIGDGDFEDRLCDIDRDTRIVGHDGLLSLP